MDSIFNTLTSLTTHISQPAFQAKAELAYVLTIYFFAFNLHTRFTAPVYKKTFAASSRAINGVLITHIIAGLSEVLLYHIMNCIDETVMPTKMALLLCYLQSATNMMLVKYLRRGVPAITRPSYQAGAILRPLLSTAAYLLQDAEMHRSSVKIINAFIYTRAIVWLLQHTGIQKRYRVQYAIAVPSAAIVSMFEGGLLTSASRIIAYLSYMALIAITSRHVTKQLESSPEDGKAWYYKFLAYQGFVSLHYLRKTENDTRADVDEYEIIEDVAVDNTTKMPTTMYTNAMLVNIAMKNRSSLIARYVENLRVQLPKYRQSWIAYYNGKKHTT